MAASMLSKSALAGRPLVQSRPSAARPSARTAGVVRAADRPLFFPGAAPPEYLVRRRWSGIEWRLRNDRL